jgi:hypothetical protein
MAAAWVGKWCLIAKICFDTRFQLKHESEMLTEAIVNSKNLSDYTPYIVDYEKELVTFWLCLKIFVAVTGFTPYGPQNFMLIAMILAECVGAYNNDFFCAEWYTD